MAKKTDMSQFEFVNPFHIFRNKIENPPYKTFITQSAYIAARDGTLIAADILLPKGIPDGKKLSTILIQTRYWRAIKMKNKIVDKIARFATNPNYCSKMVKYGFALVEIDVRGTGASISTRRYPFSPEEVEDGRDVMNWIIEQPWSDGEIVCWGNSYTGMTAERACALHHPNHKGSLIKHNPWDIYLSAAFPGGVYNKGFMFYWSSLGRLLDEHNSGGFAMLKPVDPIAAKFAPKLFEQVKPVNLNYILLKKAEEAHKKNLYPDNYGVNITCRDDFADDEKTLKIDEISIFTFKDEIESSKTPMMCWAGWQDSITADTTITRFFTFSNPQVAIVGGWNHKERLKANPYFPPKEKSCLPHEIQTQEWTNFYKECIIHSKIMINSLLCPMKLCT